MTVKILILLKVYRPIVVYQLSSAKTIADITLSDTLTAGII